MTTKEKRIVTILLLLVLLLGAVSIIISLVNQPSGPDDASVGGGGGGCIFDETTARGTTPCCWNAGYFENGNYCKKTGQNICNKAPATYYNQLYDQSNINCTSGPGCPTPTVEGTTAMCWYGYARNQGKCIYVPVDKCITFDGNQASCDCGCPTKDQFCNGGQKTCRNCNNPVYYNCGGTTPPVDNPPVDNPPVGNACGTCGDGSKNACCPGGSRSCSTDAEYQAGYYACNTSTVTPPPPPPPPPPTTVTCGQYCNESAGILCNTTDGVTSNAVVRCVNNRCININCPGGGTTTTIPGRRCDCGGSVNKCGERCGNGLALCGKGLTCTFLNRAQCDTVIPNGKSYCVPVPTQYAGGKGDIPNSTPLNGKLFQRLSCGVAKGQGYLANGFNNFISHPDDKDGKNVTLQTLLDYVCKPPAEIICGDALCNGSTQSGGNEECELSAVGSTTFKSCSAQNGAAPTGASVNCNPSTCKTVAPKYKCNTTNNACEVATDGTYDSAQACDEGTLCGANSYNCVNNSCSILPGTGGQYSSAASCNTACSPQLFCGNATCQSGELCERDGAGNFRACTAANATAGSAPSGAIVSSCRGMTTATGTTAATGSNQCSYCGDGVIQTGGGEQCDGGANCNASCQLIPYCGDSVCNAGEKCEVFNPSVPTVFGACSTVGQAPTAPAIAECRGIVSNAGSQLANSCQFCGDGMKNGPEACDPTDLTDTDTIAGQCAPNCTVVPIQCISLAANGPDPLDSSAGTFVEYTLTYQNIAATNPYPNIRLRVGPNGSEVGRNANTVSSDLVAPYQVSRASSGRQWTYKFRWEALEVGGGTISSGTYDVRALLDGTNATAVTTPSQCLDTLTVNSTPVTEPLFTIIKSGAEVCQSNGNSQINYTITLRNIGEASGTPDFITDTLDAQVIAAGITPTSISNGGAYATGVITWDNTDIGAMAAGTSKTFTYSVIVPAARIVNFSTEGVDNIALVQYDTTTTNNNVDSFSLNTPMDCNPPAPEVIEIPVTGITASGARYILFGIMFMLLGLIVFRKGFGTQGMQDLLQTAFMRSPFGHYEEKVDLRLGRKAKGKK